MCTDRIIHKEHVFWTFFFHIQVQWKKKKVHCSFVYVELDGLFVLFRKAVSDLVLLAMRDWHHFLCPNGLLPKVSMNQVFFLEVFSFILSGHFRSNLSTLSARNVLVLNFYKSFSCLSMWPLPCFTHSLNSIMLKLLWVSEVWDNPLLFYPQDLICVKAKIILRRSEDIKANCGELKGKWKGSARVPLHFLLL